MFQLHLFVVKCFYFHKEKFTNSLNKNINNISTIFPYYFKMRYKFAVLSLWMRYLDGKGPYLQVLIRLIFQNFHVRHLSGIYAVKGFFYYEQSIKISSVV